MNPQLKALHDELQSLIDERDALSAKAKLDQADMERAPLLKAEIDKKTAEVAALAGLAESGDRAKAMLTGEGERIVSKVAGNGIDPKTVAETIDADDLFKATRKLSARGMTPFVSSVIEDRSQARDVALAAGHWLRATSHIRPSQASRAWLDKRGIDWAGGAPGFQAATGQTETINEDGAFLVPEEFESAIIVLRENYGVFRQYAQVVPMGSDTKSQPRRTGGLTAYFGGDGASMTASKAAWDRVQLVAKKLYALVYATSEWTEDALANTGDLLIGEMAYAFAKKEDQCGFLGTGAQTYAGIVGTSQRLIDQFTVAPSTGDGLLLGAGNLLSELTITEFEGAVGVLPEYAETNQNWFCHKYVWYKVMMRLALASGGVPAAEIMMGGQKRFLGIPVVTTQVMPNTDANSQVVAICGSLDQAAMLGDRRGIAVLESLHDKFAQDEIGYRGTERFDINVHSVTTPDGSVAAGPIVGVITAAS